MFQTGFHPLSRAQNFTKPPAASLNGIIQARIR